MKKQKNLYFALLCLVGFIVWTVLISCIGVKAVGPEGSSVGFASINIAFHRLTGVNMTLYTITDWLGIVPFAVAFGFAILGLVQWIKRKSIFKVDLSLIVLGGYYLLVVAVYLLFENVVINYRPILIDGLLEVSYPSSTTLLTVSVMPAAAVWLKRRVKSALVRRSACLFIYLFTAFMVVSRLISGVHWLSDIVGGLLLSTGLVMLYAFLDKKLGKP